MHSTTNGAGKHDIVETSFNYLACMQMVVDSKNNMILTTCLIDIYDNQFNIEAYIAEYS